MQLSTAAQKKRCLLKQIIKRLIEQQFSQWQKKSNSRNRQSRREFLPLIFYENVEIPRNIKIRIFTLHKALLLRNSEEDEWHTERERECWKNACDLLLRTYLYHRRIPKVFLRIYEIQDFLIVWNVPFDKQRQCSEQHYAEQDAEMTNGK